MWRLAQRLRLVLFMPGDTIYDIGSVGHEMFIIWKGAVGLTSRDGCVAALLVDNDHFGELGLMNVNTPRPHHAVALRQCDVMVLNLWDLQVSSVLLRLLPGEVRRPPVRRAPGMGLGDPHDAKLEARQGSYGI